MEIPRSDVPSGTIVQVFQAGFMIEDRVLRPAMVAVAKGGPKLGTGARGGCRPCDAAACGTPHRANFSLSPSCRRHVFDMTKMMGRGRS